MVVFEVVKKKEIENLTKTAYFSDFMVYISNYIVVK